MDIAAALMKEHSKAQCDKVVRYIGNNKERFAELMKLFFKGEYRMTQRAAWPMSNCVRNHPELIKPYLNRLLKNLKKPDLHNAIVRNTIRLLEDIDIPAAHEGRVMDLCFNFIQSNDAAIAVKAFSLGVLKNLSKKYPEILHEIRTIIRERWEHETPAFRSRAKKLLT